MVAYIGRRLLATVVTLFLASVIIFLLLRLAPGDPASVLAGPDAGTAQVNAIRHELGLDQPLAVQYLQWIGGVLTGDFGMSYSVNQPIGGLLLQRLPSTVELTVAASILMIGAGVLFGILLATRVRLIRPVIDALSTVALSSPPFVSGIVLIFVFAVVFRALPSGGDAPVLTAPGESLSRLVMPAVALALPGAAVVARLLATEMRRVREGEFVKTAVSKGMSVRRVFLRHLLRSSLGAAVVEMGIRVGEMLGGAIVVEAIFVRAGLGSLLVKAVEERDYPLAQAVLLFAIGAVILIQLISDLVVAALDPRIRLGEASR